MDEDPNKTTSSATDEWGAANETSEPTTFGATTTDADGTFSFIFYPMRFQGDLHLIVFF